MRSRADIRQLADQLGVSMVEHDGGPKGWYYHPTRVISLRRGLTIAQWKSTAAHELAHAHFGDTCLPGGLPDPRIERRADQWAATWLLHDHSEVLRALAWADGHHHAAAHELEVSPHLLEVWAQSERISLFSAEKNAMRFSVP